MYGDLQDKVVLITGGASGLGLAAAHAFHQQGTKVVIIDLNEEAAHRTAREVGAGALGISADVTNEADIAAAVKAAVQRYGRLDIVINCAGTPDSFKPTVEQDVAAFRRLVDIHLTGTYIVSKTAAVHMLEQRSGAILNLSSVAGVVGLTPRNAYSASKAGIGMMTRTLACEWAARGVRVNAIAPGYTMTPFVERLLEEGKIDGDKIRKRTPVGRFGTPQNIADAMLFLASNKSEFITGVTLPVDGGYSAWGTAGDACPELSDA